MVNTKEHISSQPESHASETIATRRAAGGRALDAVDVRRPAVRTPAERASVEAQQELVHNALAQHLEDVQNVFERHGRGKLTLNADTVHLAYIALSKRLQDPNETDEMTTSQLTGMMMARAVLYSPVASEALKSPTHRKSKEHLSEWNDLLGDIVRTLPSNLAPGYKANMVEALRRECLELNKKIGHSSEISRRNPESGIYHIMEDLHGVEAEIAVERGISRDPRLRYKVPKHIKSDLEGIDGAIQRDDGKLALIDAKSHRQYIKRIKLLEGLLPTDHYDDRQVGPFYYTGNKHGYPHFLLDTDAFGEIPADGFEYTAKGQTDLQTAVHRMLDHKY